MAAEADTGDLLLTIASAMFPDRVELVKQHVSCDLDVIGDSIKCVTHGRVLLPSSDDMGPVERARASRGSLAAMLGVLGSVAAHAVDEDDSPGPDYHLAAAFEITGPGVEIVEVRERATGEMRKIAICRQQLPDGRTHAVALALFLDQSTDFDRFDPPAGWASGG